MHSLKQYVLLKILIENIALYFSNRALRAGKTSNKWLKKPVVQNIFYSKYSVDFRKVLVKKKCINGNKSKLRIRRKLLETAFFQ